MPSDEALQQQATEWKTKGNEAFAAGQTGDAVASYSSGIAACDRVTVQSQDAEAVKAALLGNRAMCHLKILNLQPAIDDCTTALELPSIDGKMRSKLWFRRAKARFLLNSMPGKSNPDLLQDAAKDLLMLLNQDPSNKEAQQLLTTVRGQHKVTQTATTPVSKTVSALKQAASDDDKKEQLQQVKRLLGLLDNDLVGSAREMGRLEGVELLLQTAESAISDKLSVLSMQCLSTSCSHPAFVREYAVQHQKDILRVIEKAEGNDDLIVTSLAALARIILHADRDDPVKDVVGDTQLDYACLVQCMTTALRMASTNNSVTRAVLDVLATWTAGTEREAAIRTSLGSHHDPTLPAPKTQQEIRMFTPQELAAYKKRQLDLKTRDQAWAFHRALCFVESGLKELLQAATSCPDHVVRREIAVAVGRLLACIMDDDKIKEAVTPFLQSAEGRGANEPVIEEVYNEDGEAEDEEKVEEVAVTLETKMERALITSALLLSKKDVGAWALSYGWRDSDSELPDLIESNNPRAMCLASEVLSAAATVEAARPMVVGLTSSGSMEKLMMSEDRDIRSGAASAVAKLGLSERESDEGEIMGLLLAACELLEDSGQGNDDGDKAAKKKVEKSKTELKHFSSFATSSVERAIEMITYLISHTLVKEELAAGFSSRTDAAHSALDRLVQTADLPAAGESLSGFGLATIFQHMAATNLQIRKEAFEGKEVTMEQYDEMQRMGKTEEEKEIMDKQIDPDTKDLCGERIRKMAAANVPRALVTLTEGASEHTLEQLFLTMNRMADEVAVRGILIQQGVLSACIKVEKNEGPTETDVMKKVIRLARHCIAKMLISTNPSLLTSAQKLGSIRPLIQLIRDNKASELQHFEALLSVTNLAGSGEDAKNRVVTEKGIATFHFAMFSDHEMVRTAATEAMCNLVPHKGIMDHLAINENLRLWMAFAVDFEENYECARAATGTLAMASQDLVIAQEIANLAKFKEQMSALLECGRLEIMHRTLVIVMNLVLHGSETRQKTLEAGLVQFCRAYVELQNHPKEEAPLEFSPEEQQILPVTVELAKKIVQSADE